MNMFGIIYKATNKINNKSYIGQTIRDFEQRIKDHYLSSMKHTYKFANALKKYNLEDWDWTILQQNVPYQCLNEMEHFYIFLFNTFKNGYNATTGGKRCEMSEESCKKISKAYMGIGNPMYGKKQSEEHKNKISLSLLGNKNSLGHKESEEHKAKISNSLSKQWKIILPNGDIKIIKNLSKYCRENNLDTGHMTQVAKYQRKHHKGYRVEKI